MPANLDVISIMILMDYIFPCQNLTKSSICNSVAFIQVHYWDFKTVENHGKIIAAVMQATVDTGWTCLHISLRGLCAQTDDNLKDKYE